MSDSDFTVRPGLSTWQYGEQLERLLRGKPVEFRVGTARTWAAKARAARVDHEVVDRIRALALLSAGFEE